MHLAAQSLVLAAVGVMAGCGESPLVSATSRPIIYGDDGRRELFEVSDQEWVTDFARARVAALVPHRRISITSDGVVLSASAAVESQALCEGVQFREQPALAQCSAVLVTDELVLTAGHCARLCAQSRIVFGLYYDEPGVLHPIQEDDLFDCIDVVTDVRDQRGVDYAWLRIDRPRGLVDAPWRPSPDLQEGLTLLGFPGGVPMKVEQQGAVADIAGPVFLTNHDAFAGHSGGPLLDDEVRIVGVFGGGAPDLVETSDGCFRPRVTNHEGIERSTNMAAAVEGLCSASPCEGLCARGDQASSCEPTGGCSACGRDLSDSVEYLLVLLLGLWCRRLSRAPRAPA